MNKDQGRYTRRATGKRSAPSFVRSPKRAETRAGSATVWKTATGRGPASPTADQRGGLTQDISPLAAGLGRIAAQAFRHVRISRFRAALADAQQLVRMHPLQMVLSLE